MSYLLKDKSGNVIFDTAEISGLSELFSFERSHNLFDISDPDVALNRNLSQSGEIIASSPENYYSVTGFIPCEEGKTYAWASFRTDGTKKATNVWGAAWFDGEKNFISFGTNTNGNYTFRNTAPENAAYMRLRVRTKETFEDITGLFVFESWYSPKYFEPFGKRKALLKNALPAVVFDPFEFRGKTLAVLGDSISTLDGENVPELTITEADVGKELSAYPSLYDLQDNLVVGGHTIVQSDLGKELTFTPTESDIGKSVGKALTYYSSDHKPWWKWLCEELGLNAVNASWSGSSVTSHEANSNYYLTAHAWHDSQIRRCGKRVDGTTNRLAPDYIIIFRGCNDFSHSPYAYINPETFESGSFSLPETDKLTVNGETKFGIKEGLCLTISKLRAAYPKAKIFLAAVMTIKRGNETAFPCKNTFNTLPQFNKAIFEAAEYFGCGVIRFDKIFSFESVSDSFDHPDEREHYEMFRQALKDFLK